jgi:putative toxin-antitoxin system antitoxin component (TIGR02293 family)
MTAYAAASANDNYTVAAGLLGGKKVLKQVLTGPAETHDLLVAGLPGRALSQLFKGMTVIKQADALENGVGISLRTYQRSQKAPAKPLSTEQSARTWVFASVLAQAMRAFGSRELAEDWLQRPALALGQKRPIDLLATHEGVDLVRTLLGRIEYGVYT